MLSHFGQRRTRVRFTPSRCVRTMTLALVAAVILHLLPVQPLRSSRVVPRGSSMCKQEADPQPALDWIRTLDTLITRGLDTVEDAFLLARRVADKSVDPIDCLEAWEDATDPRPRLLIIGSGWGAHALVKIVDADLFRCLVISPRSYFVFTPMLAASSVGTVEYRSITEPMRASNPRAAFIQGVVEDLDPITRRAAVCIGDADGKEADGKEEEGPCRQVYYDICVYAAGVRSSASNIPGVIEHCKFLKELSDAQALRRSVASALERASAPGLSEEERRRMLTFVVVGGGPTGVEYCGELSDFLVDAVQRLYPPLVPYAQVVLVHSGAEVLPQFDPLLRKRALETLRARRVKVMLNARVSRVDSPQRMVLKQKRFGDGGAGSAEVTWDVLELQCGLIMWAAGTGPAALTETLVRRLVDCTRTADEPDEPDETSTSPSEATDESGLRPEFWARQWTANGQVVASNAVGVPTATPGRLTVDPWLRVRGAPVGTLLAIGDASSCYSADGSLLPQTAQVAAQQGAYVARLLNRGYDLSGLPQGAAPSSSPGAMLDEGGCELAAPPVSHAAVAGDLQRTLALRGAVEARPFAFLNLGLLAYLGGGEALSQVQVGNNRLLSEAGSVGFLLWRSVYVVKQVSPRTRFLVLFDWLKTKLFGRDITDW